MELITASKFRIHGLVIFLLINIIPSSTFAQNPNPGPRSETEAKLLFQEAKKLYLEEKYPQAIESFQRYLQRYPSRPKNRDAELYLGQAYQRNHQYRESLAPFHHFIEQAKGAGIETKVINSAKIFLARSELDLQQASESMALIQEVLKTDLELDLKLTALLIKTEILSFQNKFKEAKAALDAYEDLSKPSLEAKLFRFRIRTAECTGLPEPKTSRDDFEEKMMTYFEFKVTCLKEALPTQEPKILEHARYGNEMLKQWCLALKNSENELLKSKLDQTAIQKTKLTFERTKTHALTLQKALLNCYEPHSTQK